MSEKSNNPDFEANTEDLTLPDATGAASAVPEAVEETAVSERRGYQNPSARLMNGFFYASLLFTVLYLGFQVYLSVSSYIAQQAPMSIAVLYTFASILMPLIMLFALSFVFKFFAEVLELMDRRNHMKSLVMPSQNRPVSN